MTFEELQKANETIKHTDIGKGKEYAEVNQRIKAFRMVIPAGTIETNMISLCEGVVIFKATVKDEEGKVLGTGTAYEKEGSSFINKTSYIENCETSAVGRALAMCGFGIDLSIASYEEVANAKLNQEDVEVIPPSKPKKEDAIPPREKLLEVVKKHFPDGSKNQKMLLDSNGLKKIEDATDMQLLAVYNKFSGK